MIFEPYTRADRVEAMTDMMRWIYLYFRGNPAGGQVLGMLLL